MQRPVKSCATHAHAIHSNGIIAPALLEPGNVFVGFNSGAYVCMGLRLAIDTFATASRCRIATTHPKRVGMRWLIKFSSVCWLAFSRLIVLRIRAVIVVVVVVVLFITTWGRGLRGRVLPNRKLCFAKFRLRLMPIANRIGQFPPPLHPSFPPFVRPSIQLRSIRA